MDIEEIKAVMAYGPNCMNEDQYHVAVQTLLAERQASQTIQKQYESALERLYETVTALTKWKAEHMIKSSSREALQWAANAGSQAALTEAVRAIKTAKETGMLRGLTVEETVEVLAASLLATRDEFFPVEGVQ